MSKIIHLPNQPERHPDRENKIVQALPQFSITAETFNKVNVCIIGTNQELARIFFACFSTIEPNKRAEIYNAIIYAMNEAEKTPKENFSTT